MPGIIHGPLSETTIAAIWVTTTVKASCMRNEERLLIEPPRW